LIELDRRARIYGLVVHNQSKSHKQRALDTMTQRDKFYGRRRFFLLPKWPMLVR
jgi:hypothetical protein